MEIQGMHTLISGVRPREAQSDEVATRGIAPADTEKTASSEHPAGQVDSEQLKELAKGLEQFAVSQGRTLKFHVHEESDRLQVDVIDPRDDKVIKQIPPDEILKLATSIEETVGMFLNKVF